MQAPEGFAEFVTQRQSALLRLAWALTGDRQLGEDLAQTAFAKLWPHWDRVARGGDPWGYVQRIVVSTYATWWRRRWRGETSTGDVPEPTVDEDPFAAADSRDAVARWLAVLPARQRAVVSLRFVADLSVTQTADLMGCSTGTVKSQTVKALDRLHAVATPSTQKSSTEDRMVRHDRQ